MMYPYSTRKRSTSCLKVSTCAAAAGVQAPSMAFKVAI